MTSQATAVWEDRYQRDYRSAVQSWMKQGQTCLSSKDRSASILLDCIVTPARTIDLAVRLKNSRFTSRPC